MSYLIVYDIRRLDNRTRLRVYRRLRKLGALKLQHSVWELSRLADLLALVGSIKSSGGRALVLRKASCSCVTHVYHRVCQLFRSL